MNPSHVPASITPVCDSLRATGNWNRDWNPFATLDPAWTEKFIATGISPMVSGVLGIHTMSLGAPILLEELAARAERHGACAD